MEAKASWRRNYVIVICHAMYRRERKSQLDWPEPIGFNLLEPESGALLMA